MGPPTTIPERAKFLRKSKSTNTLKLPKRDEATKPGYCECCRLKFEDFRNVRPRLFSYFRSCNADDVRVIARRE